MSDKFIPAGTRWECPECQRILQFAREVTDELLPVTISCPHCTYKHVFVSGERAPDFPKLPPDARQLSGNWRIEFKTDTVKPDYWQPITGQVSFRERCNHIATHVAGAVQAVNALQGDLQQLTEAVTQQFAAEWERHSAFLRLWNPGQIEQWIRQPFLTLPVACRDELIRERVRLFLAPNFFHPVVGYPVKSLGGFQGQMITPYLLIEFPLETWLQHLMTIPPTPDLQVRGDRIFGRDLPYCWKDIPGTVPAPEHLEDAPVVQIKAGTARQFLAKLGVSPWPHLTLTEEHAFRALWSHFSDETVKHWQRKLFADYVCYGRLAVFCHERLDAWEFVLTVAQYTHGHKLFIVRDEEQASTYRQAFESRLEFTMRNRTIHWISADQLLTRPPPWEKMSMVVLDYEAEFPVEILEQLYQYSGHLLLISQDMLMDTLEENWEAALFYGLVGKSYWQLPNIDHDYTNQAESVAASLLTHWHDNPQIKAAGAPSG